uniref:Uncharacterized protein n=1 Tax=Cacopsylla melanoneura TaxID=428564 RepID=A0A8D8PR14_9HEMI
MGGRLRAAAIICSSPSSESELEPCKSSSIWKSSSDSLLSSSIVLSNRFLVPSVLRGEVRFGLLFPLLSACAAELSTSVSPLVITGLSLALPLNGFTSLDEITASSSVAFASPFVSPFSFFFSPLPFASGLEELTLDAAGPLDSFSSFIADELLEASVLAVGAG